MSMFKNQATGLAICAVIAITSFLVSESLWYMGGMYWFLIGLLALVHIVLSGAVLLAKPSRLYIKLSVVVLLIVGQWWMLQMLVMIVIWRLRGFAP